MITSIDQTDKDTLTAEGLADYTMKEYGVAMAWVSQLGTTKPQMPGKSCVNSNYAYKKGVGVFYSDGCQMLSATMYATD